MSDVYRVGTVRTEHGSGPLMAALAPGPWPGRTSGASAAGGGESV